MPCEIIEPDCCKRRERLADLASEAAAEIERLREFAAGRDRGLYSLGDYYAAGELISRLRKEARPCA